MVTAGASAADALYPFTMTLRLALPLRTNWPVVLAIVLLCGLATSPMASTLRGNPPIARFAPTLDVYPQSFAVAHNPAGVVYVGNTDGVISFDGEYWSLIALPNREIVRSLQVDENGRVYVGGYNALGYLQTDAAGAEQFVDLTSRFDAVLNGREFADIWGIAVAADGVYFRALRDLFWWDPVTDSVRHWHYPGKFGAIAVGDRGVVVQFRDQGFKYRTGDDWTLLPGTATQKSLVYELTPLPDGGWLTLGVEGRWERLIDDRIEPIDMPSAMPPSSRFQAATSMPDGSLVFAGVDGEVFMLDADRQSLRHFQLTPSFLADVVPAADGGFLVAANDAIYRVGWPAQWSVLGAEHGLSGTLAASSWWNNQLYVSSSAGLYRLSSRPSGMPQFVPDPRMEQAYDLLGLSDTEALVAGNHQLWRIGGDRQLVSNELIYPRTLSTSKYWPGRVYIGTEAGLRIFDQGSGLLSQLPEQAMPVSARATTLVEASASTLWYGTERHGLWRVVLDLSGAPLSQQRVDAEVGLSVGIIPAANVARFRDGRLIATTAAGIFEYANAQFVATDLDGLAALRGAEEVLRLTETDDGVQWAYSHSRLWQRPVAGVWTEHLVRAMRAGAIETHLAAHDGGMLIVNTQSMLVLDSTLPIAAAQSPTVALRSAVRLNSDGTLVNLPLQSVSPLQLPHSMEGIRFRFALPDLRRAEAQSYQGRLEGYESAFSNWSRSHGYTYSRLSPGAYRLLVRARDSTGHISNMAPFAFEVLPPWYRTWWALCAWVILSVATIGALTLAIVRRRTRRLADDKQRLEAVIEARTAEIANANLQLQQMANLDGLTGVANRRRLDQYLAQVWLSSAGRPIALLLIDVDHFKHYNDAHGHIAGDELLKQLSALLAGCLRRSEDLLARYGGEEFLAVLPGADVEVAIAVAEAMCSTLALANLGATISIGVASALPVSTATTDLIERADRALYEAKRGGRNRIVVAK